MNSKAIEENALRLSPQQRAHLAQTLLLSLDTLSESEIEEAWTDEAVERAKELDEGKVQPISAKEVEQKAKKILR